MWTKVETSGGMSMAQGLMKGARSMLPILAVLFFLTALALPALAAPTNVPIIGEIDAITLDDPATTDPYARGRIVVGGQSVIIPRNLLIDLPANRLSLWQIFDQAPAGCKAGRQTGLGKTDTCNATGTGGIATITAVRTNAGDIIAGDVFIQKAAELVTGTVTYIDYTNGYFRVNGAGGADSGAMIRLNDPTSRHTIQQGPGCAGGPNCSADPRFTLDPDNYVITFATGYPACIPSTVPRAFPGLPAAIGIPEILAGTTQAAADGTGDLLCPDTNRTPASLLEPAVADSRRFAPIMVGDSVTAEGNFETVGGVRFLSTHTLNVNKALSTRNTADQPDYLFLEEVLINVAGFYNQRVMGLFIGFTTLAPTDVDLWSLHRDPVTNEVHEFPLGSVQGCDGAAGAGTCGNQGLVDAGANIFKIRYDVDFRLALAGNPPGGADAKLSPCLQLRNAASRFTGQNVCPGGGTFAENFGILSPAPHEIQARTGHSITFPGLVTLDINGAEATNGQYLFPLGLNLGGLEAAEMVEVDLNKTNLPTIFEGLPWNLDRRLGPSGCLNNGGVCEGGALGTFALDPFPYTGIEPRDTSAGGAGGGLPQTSYPVTGFNTSALTNASNRIFSYVDSTLGKFNGDLTLLPYSLGTLPVDPASQGVIAPITTSLMACMANPIGPVAQNDTATANPGVSLSIDLTANDVPVFGFIDTASVAIVSGPSNSVSVGILGSVTYTAAANFSGTDTFTYTIKDFFGAVSNTATVTVTVLGPPVASPDSASTNKLVPVVIAVLANDSAPQGNINAASVVIETQGASGTGVVNANGTITYTPNSGVLSGTDNAMTYSVANTNGARSNAAAVTVTINNVDTVPLALNDAATTPSDTAVSINVLANDTAFGATLNPATVNPSVPSLGSAVTNTLTGAVTYTPNPGATGQDSFTYTVMDSENRLSNTATVLINIATSTPVANPDAATTSEDAAVIINLTANDTDGDGNLLPGTVAITAQPSNGVITNPATGSVTYTPNANFNGSDSFAYTVSDALGAVSNAAIVTVTVTAVNDAPTAANDVTSTVAGTARTLNLVANDTDADGTVVAGTVAIASAPANGIATNLGTGSVTYTPNAGFSGIDTFTYTVRDNLDAVSAPATVTVNVTSTGTVAVLQAQFRTVSPTTGDWRVEGTATANTLVTIRVGRDLTGAIVGTTTAAADGKWRFEQVGSTVLPGPTNTISVSTAGGASRLAFPVSVR